MVMVEDNEAAVMCVYRNCFAWSQAFITLRTKKGEQLWVSDQVQGRESRGCQCR